MTTETPTFGRAISDARKKKNLSQKELSERIVNEDAKAISPQYLNDIEHDRRSPSSDHLVQQFAKVLDIDPDYLYFLAGRIPRDLRIKRVDESQVRKSMSAFRRTIEQKKN